MNDARPLALRLAVVSGHTIVEERLLAAGTPVTIGRGPRALVQAAEESWPRRLRLLAPVPGGWRLRVAPGMSARIAPAGEPRTLDGPAVLRERARARIVAGALVILVQVVRAPAPAPRPRLPASLRRSPLALADQTFAVVAALSLLLHGVLVAYVNAVDWPRVVDAESVPDRFLSLAARRLPTMPPTAPTTEAAPSASAPRRIRRQRPNPVAETASERRVRLERAVARTGLVALLTARGEHDGALRDLLSVGSVDVDQERALRDVGTLSVATADESLRGLHASNAATGRMALTAELRGDAAIADAVRIGPAAERAAAHVNLERPSLDAPPGATIDPGIVAREVKLRLSAIRGCYERALKRHPALAGKLVVRFTIAPSGAVSAVEVDDDTLGDPEVASCLRAIVARWRFPSPGAAAVEVQYPFVFQSAS